MVSKVQSTLLCLIGQWDLILPGFFLGRSTQPRARRSVQLYCTSLKLLCCCETIQYLNTKCVTSVFSLDLNLTLWARGYAFQSIAKASTRVDTRARDNSASLASLPWRRRYRGTDSSELLRHARCSEDEIKRRRFTRWRMKGEGRCGHSGGGRWEGGEETPHEP